MYRRSRKDSIAQRQWLRFVEAHEVSFAKVRFSRDIYITKSAFDHWLMHGYHPDDRSRFTIEQMDTQSRAELLKLLHSYASWGFSDPGIAFLTSEERRRVWQN